MINLFNCLLIDLWFFSVKNFRVVKAGINAVSPLEIPPVTPNDVKQLLADCEWVKYESVSDTPYAQSKYLHPISLVIGKGDFLDACQGKDGTAIHFFEAYNESIE